MFLNMTLYAAIPLLTLSALSLWNSFEAMSKRHAYKFLQGENMYVSELETENQKGEA